MMSHHARLRLFPLLLLTAALVFPALGCKSPGEKKYEEAKALQKRGMTTEAITAYEESARLLEEEGKEPGRAWDKLGGIHKATQSFTKAEELYKKAIADDPTKFDRYVKLMSVYRQWGKYDEALAVYEGIRSHPDLRFELRDRDALDDAKAQVVAAKEQAERDAARAAEDATAAAAPTPEPAPADAAPASDAPAADSPAAPAAQPAEGGA